MSDPMRVSVTIYPSEYAELHHYLQPLNRKERGRRLRMLLRLGFAAMQTGTASDIPANRTQRQSGMEPPVTRTVEPRPPSGAAPLDAIGFDATALNFDLEMGAAHP